MSYATLIVGHKDDPEELERLYRASRRRFADALPEALREHPDSLLLRAWTARLAEDTEPEAHAPEVDDKTDSGPSPKTAGFLVAGMIVLVGTIAKLPGFFPDAVDGARLLGANLGSLALLPIGIYFLYLLKARLRTTLVFAVAAAAAVVLANTMPFVRSTDSTVLAILHIPFMLWALVGVVFVLEGRGYVSAYQDYARLTVDAVIHGVIVVIAWLILMGIMTGLFELMDMGGVIWDAFGHVWQYFAFGLPVLLVLLLTTQERNVGRAVAPLIARIFSPIVFLLLFAYLAVSLFSAANPYGDREFLMIFNGVLAIVLAIVIFTVVERDDERGRGFYDYANAALIGIVLVMDVLALAMVFHRMLFFEAGLQGLTPNRLALLGFNVLAFAHLGGALYLYGRYFVRTTPYGRLRTWVVGLLPAYGVWAAFMAYVSPFLFGFK